MGEISLSEEKARDNRIVSGWLLNYHERKKQYEQKREEILHSSTNSTYRETPGRTTAITDTTARKGQELARLKNTEQWLDLVEELERRLPRKMKIILRLRRECKLSSRKRGYWIFYVQRKYVEEIAAATRRKEEDVWIGEHAIQKWWERILEYAARLAGKRGLL